MDAPHNYHLWDKFDSICVCFMRGPKWYIGKYNNGSYIEFIWLVIAVICNLNVGPVSNYPTKEKYVWFHLESIDWESSCKLMVISVPFRETHLKVEVLRLNGRHCKGQSFMLHIPKFMRFRFHINRIELFLWLSVRINN